MLVVDVPVPKHRTVVVASNPIDHSIAVDHSTAVDHPTVVVPILRLT